RTESDRVRRRAYLADRATAVPLLGIEDQRERCIDFILKLGPETGLARFVVVDLTINLGNREPMNSKIHRRARAILRCRTYARYSSTVIVSAMPARVTECGATFTKPAPLVDNSKPPSRGWRTCESTLLTRGEPRSQRCEKRHQRLFLTGRETLEPLRDLL